MGEPTPEVRFAVDKKSWGSERKWMCMGRRAEVKASISEGTVRMEMYLLMFASESLSCVRRGQRVGVKMSVRYWKTVFTVLRCIARGGSWDTFLGVSWTGNMLICSETMHSHSSFQCCLLSGCEEYTWGLGTRLRFSCGRVQTDSTGWRAALGLALMAINGC